MKYNFLLSKLYAATLVVGGGPSGLGTAIEAARQGDEVIVLEKRPEYTREQTLFLTGDSLERLDHWGVDLPELHIAQAGPNDRIGFVAIRHLEKQMAEKAKALGVQIHMGTFIGIEHQEAIAEIDGNEVRIPYEILVGADGAHSKVREELRIGVASENRMYGISAIIPVKDVEREMDVSSPIQTKWGYARRIATPAVSIVFLQSKNKLSREEMVLALTECGWQEEASFIKEPQNLCFDNDIEVLLQQADRFSDPQKRAILVGDAAATASFFEGKGANTAIQSAAIAGRWLKYLKKGERNPFDQEMQDSTNALLEDSRYLFVE
jgi:2-polyprenyl-6-methoxyphenol hydroxylase-like FAD-dependent oxidoreductase